MAGHPCNHKTHGSHPRGRFPFVALLSLRLKAKKGLGTWCLIVVRFAGRKITKKDLIGSN